MKEILKKIVDQFTSGRYILTIICGVVFAYCAWKRVLTAEAITAIISMVFISYFQRQDRGNGTPKQP